MYASAPFSYDTIVAKNSLYVLNRVSSSKGRATGRHCWHVNVGRQFVVILSADNVWPLHGPITSTLHFVGCTVYQYEKMMHYFKWPVLCYVT